MQTREDRGRMLAERRRSNAAGRHRVRRDGRRQSRRTRTERAIRESRGQS